MIMDGLESMSASFAEAHTHFQHLLNFDAFKTELPSGTGIQQHPEVAVAATERMDDGSLNTPISSFMDLPIFFSGASLPIAPPPPTTASQPNNNGKNQQQQQRQQRKQTTTQTTTQHQRYRRHRCQSITFTLFDNMKLMMIPFVCQFLCSPWAVIRACRHVTRSQH